MVDALLLLVVGMASLLYDMVGTVMVVGMVRPMVFMVMGMGPVVQLGMGSILSLGLASSLGLGLGWLASRTRTATRRLGKLASDTVVARSIKTSRIGGWRLQ